MHQGKSQKKRSGIFAAAVLAGVGVDLASYTQSGAAVIPQNFNATTINGSFGDQSTSLISAGAVTPGDTFNIAVVGFTNSGSGAFLVPSLTPTFGGTQVFAGPAFLGQNVTVTSSEVIGLLTTTDTVTISVPTSFDPNLTLGGAAINNLQLDVGGYNGLTNHIDFAQAINPLTVVTSSSTTYNTGSGLTVFPLGPAGDTFFNSNSSIALVTGVTVGPTGNASDYNFTSFTVTATYTNPVPEPTSLGLISLGGAGLLRRNRRRQQSV